MSMDKDDRPLKEYVGFIWIDDQPGVRLRLMARDAKEARAAVEGEYGEGHIVSLKNQQDSEELR